MFEVQVAGRDIFVRPSTDTWRTFKGSDGRDWIELSREQAMHLSYAVRQSDELIDFYNLDEDEDG
jgi:hypothetical protein